MDLATTYSVNENQADTPINIKHSIGYSKVLDFLDNFNPKIIIPMHYEEKKSNKYDNDKLKNFLSIIKHRKILKNSISISKEMLPKYSEVWVLESK